MWCLTICAVLVFALVSTGESFVISLHKPSFGMRRLGCGAIPEVPPPAYVARVEALSSIPGKDRIMMAKVKGGDCVVKKGEFEVGSLAVYVGLDSVVNIKDPTFSFLKTERITPAKVAGVMSYGLMGPLDWLTSHGVSDISTVKEGDDLSALLGVTKYVEPVVLVESVGSEEAAKPEITGDEVAASTSQ